MIYLVRTANGKTLAGYTNVTEAETMRAYWQHKLDESPLARGLTVEIREVKSLEDMR